MQISDLEPRLVKYWPNLTDSTHSQEFWDFAWENHGTCATFQLVQRTYFKRTLDLYEKQDMLSILTGAGYPPGSHYAVGLLINAIYKKLKVDPVIRCDCGPNGVEQIVEIVLCTDRDGMNFIPCSMHHPILSKCGRNPLLAYFRSVGLRCAVLSCLVCLIALGDFNKILDPTEKVGGLSEFALDVN
ncbi:hypothetical protein L1049_003080 [Liquidambar formosana]|uniref:Uncharacterized protein n=1 Tax=Liquidambar formosana TaxID=63359 RepID=A0AAP0NGU8_LIQFO